MTTVWTAVLIACAVAYLLKLSGYLIPPRWLAHPRLVGALGVLPAALLAALVVTQTVTSGRHLTFDARIVAVAVAASRCGAARRSSSWSSSAPRPPRSSAPPAGADRDSTVSGRRRCGCR